MGQQRQIEFDSLLAYELCAVPASLIDEHGCLRKGSKSELVKRLGVAETLPTPADIVIVDVSQLFYHIVWPHGGILSDLLSSIQGRLSHYPAGTEKIIVFDKYQDISAKDHERKRRAGDIIIDYELSIANSLPKRDVILKSKKNKQRLASLLHSFELDTNVTMETCENNLFGHDEADITMISYVLEAANNGKGVIRVLSDDSDVFVLLVYWVYKMNKQCKVQMENWNGTVLDINATCADLGPKCLQLLGMHALSGCDTTSYPYGKGKISALNTMLRGEFPGLADVLGEVNATEVNLLEAAKPFFLALYGQTPGTSMESARFTIFTKNKKSPKLMSLPPTTPNLLQHVLRAHLQVMLWKAANNQTPPDESADITKFGWKIQDNIPVPVIAEGEPVPPKLFNVIRCQCKKENKRCITEVCGCHKEHLSCTSYCHCKGNHGCCNPYTNKKDVGMVLDADMEDCEEVFADDNIDDVEGSQESEGQEDMEYVYDIDDEWENTPI